MVRSSQLPGRATFFSAAIVLCACGGGGGGDQATQSSVPATTPVNSETVTAVSESNMPRLAAVALQLAVMQAEAASGLPTPSDATTLGSATATAQSLRPDQQIAATPTTRPCAVSGQYDFLLQAAVPGAVTAGDRYAVTFSHCLSNTTYSHGQFEVVTRGATATTFDSEVSFNRYAVRSLQADAYTVTYDGGLTATSEQMPAMERSLLSYKSLSLDLTPAAGGVPSQWLIGPGQHESSLDRTTDIVTANLQIDFDLQRPGLRLNRWRISTVQPLVAQQSPRRYLSGKLKLERGGSALYITILPGNTLLLEGDFQGDLAIDRQQQLTADQLPLI